MSKPLVHIRSIRRLHFAATLLMLASTPLLSAYSTDFKQAALAKAQAQTIAPVVESVERESAHPQYKALKTQLFALRELASKGGWPRLWEGAIYKPGTKSPHIAILKKRMIMSGDLAATAVIDENYDDELKNAVSAFQQRSNLPVTGIVGPQTLAELNTPINVRIKQIEVNLQRWRDIPSDFSGEVVLVNTAAFKLFGYSKGTQALEMNVVVGERKLPTPVVSSRITSVIFNPEWGVPRKIATKELLPLQKRNPNYLSDNNYAVYEVENGARIQIDPSEVDWKLYGQNYFPFELVKRAGQGNPLGKMKFSISNEFDVYLHDTPYRGGFKQVSRTQSHGCVRLERPEDLLKFVLSSQSTEAVVAAQEILTQEDTSKLNVRNGVEVHIAYFTAWVDESGKLNFFPDVYDRDQPQLAAL